MTRECPFDKCQITEIAVNILGIEIEPQAETLHKVLQKISELCYSYASALPYSIIRDDYLKKSVPVVERDGYRRFSDLLLVEEQEFCKEKALERAQRPVHYKYKRQIPTNRRGSQLSFL